MVIQQEKLYIMEVLELNSVASRKKGICYVAYALTITYDVWYWYVVERKAFARISAYLARRIGSSWLLFTEF